MFASTLTTDDKFSLYNMENLQQPLQMQLSMKVIFCVNFLLRI